MGKYSPFFKKASKWIVWILLILIISYFVGALSLGWWYTEIAVHERSLQELGLTCHDFPDTMQGEYRCIWRDALYQGFADPFQSIVYGFAIVGILALILFLLFFACTS